MNRYENHDREALIEWIEELEKELDEIKTDYEEEISNLNEEIDDKVREYVHISDELEGVTCELEAYQQYENVFNILPLLDTSEKEYHFEQMCEEFDKEWS